jgi:hypothetical protein
MDPSVGAGPAHGWHCTITRPTPARRLDVRQCGIAVTVSGARRGGLAGKAKSDQTAVESALQFVLHPPEVRMSHASMLKARRQHQKTRKLLDLAAKQAKREAKLAAAGPVVKKEKVKKEKVKKEKVKTEKVKKVKLSKEELGRQESKKGAAGTGKKGAS